MNKSGTILVFLVLFVFTQQRACPTCVGRVTEKSAPFFCEECYQNSDKFNDSSTQNLNNVSDHIQSGSEEGGESHEH